MKVMPKQRFEVYDMSDCKIIDADFTQILAFNWIVKTGEVFVQIQEGLEGEYYIKPLEDQS